VLCKTQRFGSLLALIVFLGYASWLSDEPVQPEGQPRSDAVSCSQGLPDAPQREKADGVVSVHRSLFIAHLGERVLAEFVPL
jgi:hypothetical protein